MLHTEEEEVADSESLHIVTATSQLSKPKIIVSQVGQLPRFLGPICICEIFSRLSKITM